MRVLALMAVLLHVVGNCATWVTADWEADMKLAQEAHIDTCALNIAFGDQTVYIFLGYAFEAAENVGFKLFFSFDTPAADSAAYFLVDGAPLVSTFEGPLNAEDWVTIKVETGCFFLPDWSSEGFYTNLPGYNKTWMWRGDGLWFDRWQEVWVLQPDFVEILTWNDYGESHYIGPLHDDGIDAFNVGEAPFHYVTNMPHDSWHLFLPYVIDTYKSGTATIEQEGLTAWYRITSKDSAACTDGDTTGNTASQLQNEFWPGDIVEDKIFYSTLLCSEQTVTVTVNGVDLGATWITKPNGGIGMYHGSVAYGCNVGQVYVLVGTMLLSGQDILSTCDFADGQAGVMDWNTWVEAAQGSTVNKTPALNLTEQVCIEGTGVGNYIGLCEFSCQLGYCPICAYIYLRLGEQVELPDPTGVIRYPAEGGDETYTGLCTFACLQLRVLYPSDSRDTSRAPAEHPHHVSLLAPVLYSRHG